MSAWKRPQPASEADGDPSPGDEPRALTPCGFWHMVVVRRGSGATKIAVLPCGRWDCPKCAAFKAERVLGRLDYHLKARAFAYLVHCKNYEEAQRMARRLKEYPSPYMRVARDAGSVFYVVTKMKKTKEGPHPVRSRRDNIMGKLRDKALAFPGVTRVTWARAWPKVPKASTRWERVGTAAPGPQRPRQTFDRAANDAMRRFGTRMREERDIPGDSPMTPVQWEDLLNDAWDRTRHEN